VTRGRGQEPVYSFPIADVLRNMTQVICFYVIACVCLCVCVRTRMPAVLLVGLADVRRTRNSGSKRCATRRRTRQKFPSRPTANLLALPSELPRASQKRKLWATWSRTCQEVRLCFVVEITPQATVLQQLEGRL
jgi:hypothetical protein